MLNHWLAQADPEEDETSGLFFYLGIKIDMHISLCYHKYTREDNR